MPIVNPKISRIRWLAVAFVASIATAAHGDGGFYKWTDANGKVHYANVGPIPKNAVKMFPDSGPITPAAHPRASSSPTPVTFPRVDPETQKKRDETRRQILEDELSAEEKLLAEAKKGSSKEETDLHRKNVEALKKEIANVK